MSDIVGHRARLVAAVQIALTIAAVVGAYRLSEASDWEPHALVVLIAVLAVSSHLFPVETGNVRISGSFMSLVLAMALLGPAPAVTIGLASVLIDALRSRPSREIFVLDLAAYSVFPLIGGLMFEAAGGPAALAPDDLTFAFLVLTIFMVTNALNFVLVVGPKLFVAGGSLIGAFGTLYVPVLFWEMAAAIFTAVTASAYRLYGLGAVGLLASMLFIFQYLLKAIVEAENRGVELEERMSQLESMHEGMLAVMLKTLSLRDPMTARHSAAVARYSRALAAAAGLPEEDQEVVHTAGLVHDIGKFIFPDSILSAERKLTPEEREIIKLHPGQGAAIIRRVKGFERIADIVQCHHERIDGHGYPSGIAGQDIPILSRVIAVADTYDVMTARDSYRRPVSSEEAVDELRRVAGTQLDFELVHLFIGLLEEHHLSFGHSDDTDLEHELRVGRRPVVRPRLAAA